MSLIDFLKDILEEEEVEMFTADPAFTFLFEEIEDDEYE